MNTKFCQKCQEETERYADGDCTPCAKASNASYRAANKGKVNARKAAYRAANKDTIKASSDAWKAANPDRVKAAKEKWKAANPNKDKERLAAWYVANREKLNARDAAWRAANPEKASALRAAWYAANPEARRIHDQNRRARKRKSGGKLSVGLHEKLFMLQKGKCACGCKQPLGNDYHLDHIMPLALCGEHTDSNMQLLTATCNLKKSAKHPVDFMQQRGFLL